MITLREITDRTIADLPAAQAAQPLTLLQRAVAVMPPTRGFVDSLTNAANATRVIAEIKRRSPSAGWIRPQYAADTFEPQGIATQYERAGASAISCLTNSPFFGGDMAYIALVRAASTLPVLRKDFLVDPWQIWQSRAAGADAVLLIAECLPGDSLAHLAQLAHDIGLHTLIEIHDQSNLDRAMSVVDGSDGRSLLGINNRDLSSMKVDLSTTLALADRVKDRRRLVSESGIRTPQDLAHLREFGVQIVLVGEHLMQSPDPGRALSALMSNSASEKH